MGLKRYVRLAVAVATMATMLALPAVAGASNIGEEGCTPGYWKNHVDNWFEDPGNTIRSFNANDQFGDVFDVDYGDVTLIEALQGGGGKGIAGAHKILARAATAAVLNAAHEGLGYPLRRGGSSGIFALVQDAWDSDDRNTILRLATRLDRLNKLGCPLN